MHSSLTCRLSRWALGWSMVATAIVLRSRLAKGRPSDGDKLRPSLRRRRGGTDVCDGRTADRIRPDDNVLERVVAVVRIDTRSISRSMDSGPSPCQPPFRRLAPSRSRSTRRGMRRRSASIPRRPPRPASLPSVRSGARRRSRSTLFDVVLFASNGAIREPFPQRGDVCAIDRAETMAAHAAASVPDVGPPSSSETSRSIIRSSNASARSHRLGSALGPTPRSPPRYVLPVGSR